MKPKSDNSFKRARFETLEQVAFLSLQRTADALITDLSEVLKSSELSSTQYNVLRILRAAAAEGHPHDGSVPIGAIADKMITHDPDMTRLLDRLEKRGLVARLRCADDRRVVRTKITPAGVKVLESLDEPVRRSHARQLGHLGEMKLRQLVRLMTDVRKGM